MKKCKMVSISSLIACLLASCGSVNPYEGHEFIYHPAVDATCSKDGNIAYCSCSYCDDLFDPVTHKVIDEEDIYTPRLGHRWGNIIPASESTCDEHGLRAHYQCSRCHNYADINRKSTPVENLYLPFAHNLTHSNKIEPTFTSFGEIEHYHCSLCNRNFLDNLGEEEELDLIIPKLSSFDKEYEFNHVGTGLPYSLEETDFSRVKISETYMPSDNAGALSALYVAFKDKEDITLKFTFEVTITAPLTGDSIGVGLLSRSPKADGGVFRNLYGLRFADGSKFIGACHSYGSKEFDAFFSHQFSDFNFVKNADNTYTYKLKLVRDDVGVKWYVNGVLCGDMPYDKYVLNIDATCETHIGLMVRDSNKSLTDSYVFSNWTFQNNN